MPVTYPTLPTIYEPPAYSLPGGTVHTPVNSAALTTVLGILAAGDVIVLAAGTTYTGNFELPDLGGSAWTYIISSDMASLPAAGVRATSADAGHMPTVVMSSPGGDLRPAFTLMPGASKYRIVGIKGAFAAANETSFSWLTCGYTDHTSTTHVDDGADLPSNIIIDRCWVQGRNTSVRPDNNGIIFNARDSAIINSSILDICNGTSNDPTGIMAFNASARILIQNNAISASGENILIGGTSSEIGEIEKDWVIRRNHVFKDPTWFDLDPGFDGYHRTVKNLIELKKCSKCLIEGNILEDVGDSDAGQLYTGIVLTIRGQGSVDTFATIEDVTVQHNTIRRVGTWIHITNQDDLNDTIGFKRCWIFNNLFYQHNYYDVLYSTSDPWGGIRIACNLRVPTEIGTDLIISHNTMMQGADGSVATYGTFIRFEQTFATWTNLLIIDNIAQVGPNRFAITGDGGNAGSDALNAYVASSTVTGNVFIDDNYIASYDPLPGNYNPALAAVGFADYATNDFTLTSGTYRAGQANDASDGTDQGVDLTALAAAQLNDPDPDPDPPPMTTTHVQVIDGPAAGGGDVIGSWDPADHPAYVDNTLYAIGIGRGGRGCVDVPSPFVDLPCQDSAASTAIANLNGILGLAGVLTGAGNTSASSVSGPNSLFPLAQDLAGDNDRVVVTHAAGLNVNSITIALWVWADTWSTDFTSLVSKQQLASPYGAFDLRKHAGDGKVEVYIGNSFSSAQSASAMTTGAWHHVAFTYTSGSLIVYLDGVAGTANTSPTGNLSTSSADLFIGGNSTTAGRYFDGKVAGFRMYNRALTANEIKLLAGTLIGGLKGGGGGGGCFVIGPADDIGLLANPSSGVLNYILRAIDGDAQIYNNDSVASMQIPGDGTLTEGGDPGMGYQDGFPNAVLWNGGQGGWIGSGSAGGGGGGSAGSGDQGTDADGALAGPGGTAGYIPSDAESPLSQSTGGDGGNGGTSGNAGASATAPGGGAGAPGTGNNTSGTPGLARIIFIWQEENVRSVSSDSRPSMGLDFGF